MGNSTIAQQKKLLLDDYYLLARKHNIVVKQVNKSIEARKLNLEAEKQSYLPGIDLLAGYQYLSKPLEINLQTVRDGVVEGSSQQNVNTANEIYKELTGNNLPQSAQDRIYSTSKTLINGIYPNYNPPLSRQDYFTAALGIRQPIYLGGKLSTARDIAQNEYDAGNINLEIAQGGVDFALSVNYLRMMYLNSVLKKEDRIIAVFKQNRDRADELVKNELIPPYLRNWTNVSLTQAQTRKNNINLERKNVELEINKLIGAPLDSALNIQDTLRFVKADLTDQSAVNSFWMQNPAFKAIENKTSLAQSTVKASRSLQLPNIFAIGNVNLYQKDLPVTTPPWLIGIEMQWTLFSGFRNTKKVNATKKLVEEAQLAEENTKSFLQTQLQVSRNKLEALTNDISALDTARAQAAITTSMVRERLNNDFATVKDVNDAILMEEEIEKAYYVTVLGYYLALADYFNLLGTPQRITAYIQ
ncbi:TolC family protein [Solitalea sp. MAHUQ-68]|uniref:TolC family protein n=1 Tax=Solitalea agri TaxID=2953739 RepID=A0A9X2F233_9SPHI|nr:TolC family protein [Solitalea agri]MCO4293252.1 TolC family protein [Solitalea agri]